MFLESFQNQMEMLEVFFFCFAVDQDVIQVGFRKVPTLVSKWYRTSTDHSKFNIWVMTHLYEFIVNLSTELVLNWYQTGTIRSPNSNIHGETRMLPAE